MKIWSPTLHLWFSVEIGLFSMYAVFDFFLRGWTATLTLFDYCLSHGTGESILFKLLLELCVHISSLPNKECCLNSLTKWIQDRVLALLLRKNTNLALSFITALVNRSPSLSESISKACVHRLVAAKDVQVSVDILVTFIRQNEKVCLFYIVQECYITQTQTLIPDIENILVAHARKLLRLRQTRIYGTRLILATLSALPSEPLHEHQLNRNRAIFNEVFGYCQHSPVK